MQYATSLRWEAPEQLARAVPLLVPCSPAESVGSVARQAMTLSLGEGAGRRPHYRCQERGKRPTASPSGQAQCRRGRVRIVPLSVESAAESADSSDLTTALSLCERGLPPSLQGRGLGG